MKQLSRLFLHIGVFSVSALATVGAIWLAPDALPLQSDPATNYDYSKDPGIGTDVASLFSGVKVDVHGRAINWEAKRVLVVNGGPCTDCALRAVRVDLLPLSDFDKVILVFDAPEDVVRKKFPAPADGALVIVAAPPQSILQPMNFLWQGRWYELDKGKLTKLELNPGSRTWSVK